jgi:hypothetical protein
MTLTKANTNTLDPHAQRPDRIRRNWNKLVASGGAAAITLAPTGALEFGANGLEVLPDGVTITINGSNELVATTGLTSVGLTLPTSVFTITDSPLIANGTITGSFVNQNINTVFAGPSSGSAGVPTFRALVAADIPSGIGGLTTVGLLLPTNTFSMANNPLTSNGDITGTFTTQSAGTFLAGPSTGSAATPTWRSITANDLSFVSGGFGNVTLTSVVAPSSPAVTYSTAVLGSGGSASLASGDDISGTITVQVGTLPSTGIGITVTFGTTKGKPPHVQLTPFGANAAGFWNVIQCAVGGQSGGLFTIYFFGSLPTGSSFQINYIAL